MPEKETIRAIRPYEGRRDRLYYGREAGFQIETTEQIVTLAIDDEGSCCEVWGYFLSEDDFEKFISAELIDITITDTNRMSRKFLRSYDSGGGAGDVYLDGGDVLFVNIHTSAGVLQFTAYNSHNGYYGHTARVSSKQLEHEVLL